MEKNSIVTICGSRVFFSHTTKMEAVKKGELNPATIAVAMDEDGINIRYGIAICNLSGKLVNNKKVGFDNFDKEEGRKLALQRLEAGFGKFPITDYITGSSPKETALKALFELTASATTKARKWRRVLNKFNETGIRESDLSNRH